MIVIAEFTALFSIVGGYVESLHFGAHCLVKGGSTGTLVDFKDKPELAVPNDNLIDILNILKVSKIDFLNVNKNSFVIGDEIFSSRESDSAISLVNSVIYKDCTRMYCNAH